MISLAESVPVSRSEGVCGGSNSDEERIIQISASQRSAALDAIRIFSRRSAHAYDEGVISRPLQVPEVSGKFLKISSDPETTKMFVVSLRILLLRDHQNGLTQAVEGLVHRLKKR